MLSKLQAENYRYSKMTQNSLATFKSGGKLWKFSRGEGRAGDSVRVRTPQAQGLSALLARGLQLLLLCALVKWGGSGQAKGQAGA